MIEIKTFNIDKIKNNNYLWKYVSIEKFLSFVIHKELHFTRIDCFEDKLEGADPVLLLLYNQKGVWEDLLPNNSMKTQKINYRPKEIDKYIDKLKETQKVNFANCWFIGEMHVESVAMWNLYSQPNSVALRINFNKFYKTFLKENLHQCCNDKVQLKKLTLGRVDYINFQDPYKLLEIIEKSNAASFTKDISFIHENEFRVIAEIDNYEIPLLVIEEGKSKYEQEEIHKKNSQIYSLNIFLNNFNDYSFEIIFHPKMNDWVKDIICKILVQFEIKFECKNSCLML